MEEIAIGAKLFLVVVVTTAVIVSVTGYYAVHFKSIASSAERNSSLQAIAQQYNRTASSMSSTIAALRSQISSLNSQLNATSAKEATFQKEASSTASNISTYQGTITLLRSEYRNLTNLYASALDTITTKDSAVSGLGSTVSTLKINISALNDTKNELNRTINSLNQNLTKLKEKYSNVSSRYNSLNSSYENLTKNYTKLNSSYTALNSSYNSLSNKYNLTEFVPSKTKNLTKNLTSKFPNFKSSQLNTVSWNGSELFIGGVNSNKKLVAALYDPSSGVYSNITSKFSNYSDLAIRASTSNGSAFVIATGNSTNTTILEYDGGKLTNLTHRLGSNFSKFTPTGMAYGDERYLIVGYTMTMSKSKPPPPVTPSPELFSYYSNWSLSSKILASQKSGEFLGVAYNGSEFAILDSQPQPQPQPPQPPANNANITMYNPKTNVSKIYNLSQITTIPNGGIAWDGANLLVLTANARTLTTSGLFNPITHLYSEINNSISGIPMGAAWNGTSFFVSGFSDSGPFPLLYSYS